MPMPRIPQDALDRLKAEIDLPALIRAKGIELKPHGEKDLVGRCPFHDDKTPSLIVTPAKGLWHCMGACQTGGDVVSWVMKADGVSFRHAVELIRDGKASSLLATDKILKQTTVPRLPSPVSLTADDDTLLSQVVDYYHATLKQNPGALDYLTKRGLNNPEVIDTFRLGYANRTLGLRLPDKNRDAGAAIRGRLEALGVYRKASGHEHLSGSLTIPILGDAGDVLGLYGRKILPNLSANVPRHLYLPGPHRGVFNPACLESKEIILCEALIDALSFWAHGFKNVTTSYGVEGFTEEMLAAFLRHGVKRMYIAYDRDEAGDRAADKLAQKLLSEGIEVLRILFPHGMDANEYIRKVSPPEKALSVLLQSATWIGKGTKPQAMTLPAPTVEETPSPSLAAIAAAPMAEKAEPEKVNVPCQIQGEDVHLSLGDRHFRVRGLFKNLSFDLLRVNLRVSVGERYYIDQLDLYHAKQRDTFIAHAAPEVAVKPEVLKRDLGRVLLKLEELQEEKIEETLRPKDKAAHMMTAEEEKDALALLKDPELFSRILKDFTTCGMVGEDTNKLLGYLAATSRLFEDPLGVVIQSSSAAGKSSLMDAVLALMPEETRIKYSAMTGQALFYMGETNLEHKILGIVEEAGAEKASYALKILQSEKELSIASTGKDPQTGKLITQEYRVKGPVMLLMTTTKIEVDPELMNRCLVLSVDEDREQTRAIHAAQREAETLEGYLVKKERKAIETRHQNAQRLLRPLKVFNPYAKRLTFLDDKTRLRRDHKKYLILIRTIALLHQYQRPLKKDGRLGDVPYLEVTLSDIALANRIVHGVLGRSLDELPPQTRRLLHLLHGHVREASKVRAVDQADFRFTRGEVRAWTGWSDSQLKTHLSRLLDLEYLLLHRGGRGQCLVYEMLYKGEGKEGKPFLLGLLDVDALRKKAAGYPYDLNMSGSLEGKSGTNGKEEGPSLPQTGVKSGGNMDVHTPINANENRARRVRNAKESEIAHLDALKKDADSSRTLSGPPSLAAASLVPEP